MSTNRAPKPGQRQADYSNIGLVGRKTGAILKDTGARDQYGLPDIDDLFSSPQRIVSPVEADSYANGLPHPSIAGALASASVSQPIPSQYSSPRKPPPPRARSPIKTSIGSPRKSLNGSPAKTGALLQSPVRIGRVQDRSSQAPTTGHSLVDNKHKRRSLEQAPKRPSISSSASKRPTPNLQAPRRSLFEHPSSPVVQLRTNGTLSRDAVISAAQEKFHVNGQRFSGSNDVQQKKNSPRVNGHAPHLSSEAELFVRQDVISTEVASEEPELPLLAIDQPILQQPSVKAKGKRRFDEIEAEERNHAAKKVSIPVVQIEQPEEEFEPLAEGFDDEHGYEPEALFEEEPYLQPVIEADEPEELLPLRDPSAPFVEVSETGNSPLHTRLPPKKRPPLQDDPQGRPPQPAKKSNMSPSKAMPAPAKPTTKAIARPPKEKDANIAMMFEKASKKQSAPSSIQPAAPLQPPPLGKSRPKARGLQIVRGDDNPEIDGARYTRSGRTSVKPVEYWRGERVVYTEPKREGGRVSLPGIKQVIRVEDEPPRKLYKTKKKSRKARQESLDLEEENPEQEWELNAGVFAGEVPSWDSFEQIGDPEYPEQVDLAIAPLGLRTLTKAVPNATFNYAKTITLPFFHSGLVEIPSGGEKKQKLSRRNHIVFWVFEGRVSVDVSGNQFSLGRGGMWQVPRGNSYAISNPYERTARIFFAQGCYMTEDEGAAREEAEVEPEAAVMNDRTQKAASQQD